MAEGQDFQQTIDAGQAFAAQQYAQLVEARRRAALTVAQQTAEDQARLRAITPQVQAQAPPPSLGPYNRETDPGYDPYQTQRNLANEQQSLSYITSIPTPYLGPTTTYNPYTQHYFRSNADVGTNIADLGRAGQLPGQAAIVADQARNPRAQTTISALRASGARIPISESMGQFEPGLDTPEEQRLARLAQSGQASSRDLQQLAQMRAQGYRFRSNDWQRAVSRYYPAILTTIGSVGGGIAAGPGLAGAAFGAGWGGFSTGAQTHFRNPAALGIGVGAGFLGGYGGGYLGNATGLGPAVTDIAGNVTYPVASGIGSGAGSAAASTVGRQAATGQFDAPDILRNTVLGGTVGGAAGATSLPSTVFAGPANVVADTISPRRRNPYR